METKNKKQYTTPQITVVTFKLERGYASSVINQMVFWDNEEYTQQVENYTQHDVWNDGNGFWN